MLQSVHDVCVNICFLTRTTEGSVFSKVIRPTPALISSIDDVILCATFKVLMPKKNSHMHKSKKTFVNTCTH